MMAGEDLRKCGPTQTGKQAPEPGASRLRTGCDPPAARANTRTTAARSMRLSLVSAAPIRRRKEVAHGSMAVARVARYLRSQGGACKAPYDV
jgi:hypothetical protein